jgi:carboxymethylenebutenolidase
MDQRIINLYHHFTHGGMNRRQFLDRLTEMVGSATAAAALVPLLQNDYAKAAIVAPDDPRLVAKRVSYDSPKGKISGNLVQPKNKSNRPSVLVIHENRGLNAHIEDVARRYAAEGFLALAPDLLSVNGGTPNDEDKARDLHTKTEREDMIAAAAAGAAYLARHAESTGKVGTVGFCFGGGVVNRLATDSPDILAAAPYYGTQPPAEKVANIKAPLLLHYAEMDENIDKGIPAFEAALKANTKRYAVHIYAGTQHAFNNDTGAARYHKAAADLAFSRTLAFFKENLGAPKGSVRGRLANVGATLGAPGWPRHAPMVKPCVTPPGTGRPQGSPLVILTSAPVSRWRPDARRPPARAAARPSRCARLRN